MKLLPNWPRPAARPALLLALALLLGAEGCTAPRSLSQKTRWYKRHAGTGKALPCPCGH